MKALVELERRAQPLEREKMGVDAPPSDDVAARRRKLDVTASREQRAGEQNRRANLLAQLRIEVRRANRLGVDAQGVARGPGDVHPRRGDELDERLDVADARHVLAA